MQYVRPEHPHPQKALRKYYGSPSGLSAGAIASGPDRFEATLPPFVYQTAAVFGGEVCHLDSIDPLQIGELPSGLKGGSARRDAVENALSSAATRGEAAERILGPVTVRTDDGTVDVIGFVPS